MEAKNVVPKEWINTNYPIRVLYDDGSYSVIWGMYNDTKSLAVRWSQTPNSKLGFPLTNDKADWFVQPEFVAFAILQRLLSMAVDKYNLGYYENILFAINELSKQYPEIDNQEEAFETGTKN